MAKQRIIAITGASGGLAQEIVKQLSLSDGIVVSKVNGKTGFIFHMTITFLKFILISS